VRGYLLGKPIPCTFPPTVAETETALRTLIKWTQHVFFEDISKQIATGKQMSTSVCKLSPFLDDELLMRVGGHLKNSQISYDEKYPIIIN